MSKANEKDLAEVEIVGASAGTGKTTRLSLEFLRAVEGAEGQRPIDPTRIIVCTFTNKAADELSSRIRQKLFQSGKMEEAQLVLAGYVGTVNSICGSLLRDYAMEGGLSPDQEVIPEEMAANLFALASEKVIDAYAQRIEVVARRLSFTDAAAKSRYQKRAHWMEHVRNICSLARANALNAATLKASAQSSWQTMKPYLGQSQQHFDANQLDELLLFELERTIDKIDTSSDQSELTAKALKILRDCHSRARREGMRWNDWAAMKKLSIGAKSKPEIENLLSAAAIVHLHPRLHDDLQTYLQEIFECAAECLDAYQSYKRAHGLIDFIDQEYLTLALLDKQEVKDSLRSRLDLVLIDEFQDTSPIQLALFLRLASLSKRCVWVGDVKQAIYGFRGTDPQLMQEAASVFKRMDPLEASYRSRPELVHFCNEIFGRVFPNFGIDEADVLIRPSGTRASSSSPTQELWNCNGAHLDDCFASLALAVKTFLENNASTIEDPELRVDRPVRGSDIAILCRKNDHCAKAAAALAKAGLTVAMIRDGLLDSPECILAVATLRYLIDANDKFALGQIVHLTHDYNKGNQSAWLSKWLDAGRQQDRLLPHNEQLQAARKLLPNCTINDALNLALNQGLVLDMVYRWGSVPERLAKLDALRGLVVEYEVTCSLSKTPATIVGFLSYLLQLEESDQPASTDLDAVQILTYHGAKGLEWPVVILTDLDAESAPKVHKDLCKIYVESAESVFDIGDPLKGRWIRFWPWPFGSIEKDGEFENNASLSPEFAKTSRRALAENTRLMYVGMTRARDLLVLAPFIGRQKNNSGTQWLDELSVGGKPILKIADLEDGVAQIEIEKTQRKDRSTHVLKVSSYASNEEQFNTLKVAPQIFAPKSINQGADADASKPQYSIRPSGLTLIPSEYPLSIKTFDLGERIEKIGDADMSLLGECIHAFLASDNFENEKKRRLDQANRLLEIWEIKELSGVDLICMSDRLSNFLNSEFGKYDVYTECVVTAKRGQQRLRGSIDLLVETMDYLHVIDHKSFPGARDSWEKKALSFAPQLLAYKEALEQSHRKPVSRLFIHLPVVGKLIEIVSSNYSA